MIKSFIIQIKRKSNKSNLFDSGQKNLFLNSNPISLNILDKENKFLYYCEFYKDFKIQELQKDNGTSELKNFKTIICKNLGIKSIYFKTKQFFKNSLTLPDPGQSFIFFLKKKINQIMK